MLTRRTLAQLGLGAGAMSIIGSLFGCKEGGGLGLGSSHTYEGHLIKTVRYTYGGGMTGGGVSSELARQKDGSVTLTTREKEWHNSREQGFDYVVDESAFDRFAEIANEYGLLRASKRKMSDMIVYDAPTGHVSYSVMTEDGSYDLDASFSITSEQELTEREREGFWAVSTALSELAAASEGTPYLEPINATLAVNGVQFQFFLNDSSASIDLGKRGSITIMLEDHGDNGKAFHLERPLDVSDAPLATGAAGTICYDAAENSVVIFYADGAPADGLYELGTTQYAFDAQYIAEIEPGEAYFYTNYIFDSDEGETDSPAVGALCYVSYHNGGGMEGSSESITLMRDENDDVVLEYERSEGPGDEAEPERFVLDGGTFDEFARFVDEYGLRDASERPESETQALDAPTMSITFGYADEEGDLDADSLFTVSDTQDLTDEQWDGFETVIKALKDLRSQQ